MNKNIGKIDRILRTVLGLVFIALGWGVFQNNWLGLILNILAAYFLFTSVKGRCWIYSKFKISTSKPGSSPAPPSAPPQNNNIVTPPTQ